MKNFIKLGDEKNPVYIDPEKVTHIDTQFEKSVTCIWFGQGYTRVTMPIKEVLEQIQQATKVES